MALPEEWVKLNFELGWKGGVLCPIPRPPEDVLEEFERRGDMDGPKNREWMEDQERRGRARLERIKKRMVRRLRNQREREFLEVVFEAADLYPRLLDALEVARGGSDDRKYTIDQLRGAWGAGYHKGVEEKS